MEREGEDGATQRWQRLLRASGMDREFNVAASPDGQPFIGLVASPTFYGEQAARRMMRRLFIRLFRKLPYRPPATVAASALVTPGDYMLMEDAYNNMARARNGEMSWGDALLEAGETIMLDTQETTAEFVPRRITLRSAGVDDETFDQTQYIPALALAAPLWLSTALPQRGAWTVARHTGTHKRSWPIAVDIDLGRRGTTRLVNFTQDNLYQGFFVGNTHHARLHDARIEAYVESETTPGFVTVVVMLDWIDIDHCRHNDKSMGHVAPPWTQEDTPDKFPVAPWNPPYTPLPYAGPGIAKTAIEAGLEFWQHRARRVRDVPSVSSSLPDGVGDRGPPSSSDEEEEEDEDEDEDRPILRRAAPRSRTVPTGIQTTGGQKRALSRPSPAPVPAKRQRQIPEEDDDKGENEEEEEEEDVDVSFASSDEEQ